MTQLEALEIAYKELSNMMPYVDENSEIFKAAKVIQDMIFTKEKTKFLKRLNDRSK